MKQIRSYFILLGAIFFAVLFASSCSNNDDSDCIIVGKWQLIKVDYHFGGIKQCSDKNIEYQFLDTGKVMVSDDSEGNGGEIFLMKGEHQYALNGNQITIDRSTYQYRIEARELIIDTGSAWDAPIYYFKRLKN